MAAKSRPSRVRHRVYSRLRHAHDELKKFLVERGTTLSSSVSLRAVTVNATTNVLTSTAHGFSTGKGPIQFATDDTLPGGLDNSTFYWPILLTADTFQVAATRRLAADGTAIDILDVGTGNHTAQYSVTAANLFSRLLQGLKGATLRAATDIDSI